MAELKYSPVKHDQKAFLAKAHARRGFKEAYEALELEYALASQLLDHASEIRASRRLQSSGEAGAAEVMAKKSFDADV